MTKRKPQSTGLIQELQSQRDNLIATCKWTCDILLGGQPLSQCEPWAQQVVHRLRTVIAEAENAKTATESSANIMLFSTAPKMLEMCLMAWEYLSCAEIESAHLPGRKGDLKKLAGVIKKATGKKPQAF